VGLGGGAKVRMEGKEKLLSKRPEKHGETKQPLKKKKEGVPGQLQGGFNEILEKRGEGQRPLEGQKIGKIINQIRERRISVNTRENHQETSTELDRPKD